MNKKVLDQKSKPNALYACSLALAPGLGHFFCGFLLGGVWGVFWAVVVVVVRVVIAQEQDYL